jgi:hypothetical protein
MTILRNFTFVLIKANKNTSYSYMKIMDFFSAYT